MIIEKTFKASMVILSAIYTFSTYGEQAPSSSSNTISTIKEVIQKASTETATTNAVLLDHISFLCMKAKKSGTGVLTFEYSDGIKEAPSYSFFSFYPAHPAPCLK